MAIQPTREIEDEMDDISDILKRSTMRRVIDGCQIPEVDIPVLFVNERDGPQFFVGERGRAQPLYKTPAHEGQEPVAWMTKCRGCIITQDRTRYRDDIEWEPLYTAR